MIKLPSKYGSLHITVCSSQSYKINILDMYLSGFIYYFLFLLLTIHLLICENDINYKIAFSTWPWGYKIFFICSTHMKHKVFSANKYENAKQ